MVDPAHFVSSHKTPLVFFLIDFVAQNVQMYTHTWQLIVAQIPLCIYVYISYSPAESFKKIDTFYEVTLRYTVKYTQSTLM